MTAKIGVGIIGASPDRGWAASAHIPALKLLSQYEIRALSTTQADSARRAGQKFGVTRVFDSHEALVREPGVDLVVVTVKVPLHRDLVMAALQAGKHVFCEWPLGNGLAEAVEIAASADAHGVRGFVGLQARFSPAIQHVRQLVADGYVGRVLSTTLVGSGIAWGGLSLAADAYVNDRDNGATLLSIPLGHTLDAICGVLGEFATLSAVITNNFNEASVLETQARISKSSEDQILIVGTLHSGAPISIHYRGGKSRGTNFHWEINGSEGDLVLKGSGGHVQFMEPTVHGGRAADKGVSELAVPVKYRWAPAGVTEGPPLNVAQAYVRLAGDLQYGTQDVATFHHAVKRHRMLEAVITASQSGQRASML